MKQYPKHLYKKYLGERKLVKLTYSTVRDDKIFYTSPREGYTNSLRTHVLNLDEHGNLRYPEHVYRNAVDGYEVIYKEILQEKKEISEEFNRITREQEQCEINLDELMLSEVILEVIESSSTPSIQEYWKDENVIKEYLGKLIGTLIAKTESHKYASKLFREYTVPTLMRKLRDTLESLRPKEILNEKD